MTGVDDVIEDDVRRRLPGLSLGGPLELERGHQLVVRVAPVLLEDSLQAPAVHGPDAGVGRHEAHVGGRPRHQQVGVDRPSAEGDVTATVGLAHDDSQLRHSRPRQPLDDALIARQDPAAFGVGADHQTGHVLEEHEREVEGVAQVDERRLLGQRRDVHHAGALHRLTGDDADRMTLEPGERADHAASISLAPLHDRVAVEDRLEYTAHVVTAPRLSGDQRQQALGVAGGCRRRGDRRG